MILNPIRVCLKDPEDELYTEDNDVIDINEDEFAAGEDDENPETSMRT